ncbi:MAG: hypothetical protein EBR79_01280 [Proteobacteria bacterium]|nr:hypothetical protein [Pseudomonadota bacterium]NBX85743.1 hypothetical protein [Pseudomonadota bacterium]
MEPVRVPCGVAADIFREAYDLASHATRGHFTMPERATLQARIDRAEGISHQWSFPALQKPWEQLRASVQLRVEALTNREASQPRGSEGHNPEWFKWQVALTAIDAFMANDLVLSEELLNKARAYWSLHDKARVPRGKRFHKRKHLERENARLRAELARLKK